MLRLASPRPYAVAALFVAAALSLTGCNALAAEWRGITGGGPSIPGDAIRTAIEAALPVESVTLESGKSGLAQELRIVVMVPDATAVTADQVAAIVDVVCTAEPPVDYVNLLMRQGLDKETVWVPMETLLDSADGDVRGHAASIAIPGDCS